MSESMTTLFEYIKNRAGFLRRNPDPEIPEEDEGANDLAQAICEEIERLHDRIEYLNKRVNAHGQYIRLNS